MRIREHLQEIQRHGYDCDLTCHGVAIYRSKGIDSDFLKGTLCEVVTEEGGCYCKGNTYRNTVSNIDQ